MRKRSRNSIFNVLNNSNNTKSIRLCPAFNINQTCVCHGRKATSGLYSASKLPSIFTVDVSVRSCSTVVVERNTSGVEANEKSAVFEEGTQRLQALFVLCSQ